MHCICRTRLRPILNRVRSASARASSRHFPAHTSCIRMNLVFVHLPVSTPATIQSRWVNTSQEVITLDKGNERKVHNMRRFFAHLLAVCLLGLGTALYAQTTDNSSNNSDVKNDSKRSEEHRVGKE